SPIEGRRLFKNKRDNNILVLEKVRASNMRLVFLKNNEIIKPPKEYWYEYDMGDKIDTIKDSDVFNDVPCFLLGTDLFRYTFYYKKKKILQFHAMLQFSISKPKCIFGYK
ncbi:12480_t:CDS:1, partial [Cetraspora pellucida]